MHAQHASFDSFLYQAFGRPYNILQDPACGNQRGILSFTNLNGFAEFKIDRRVVYDGLAGLAQTEITGTTVGDDRACRRARLNWVARSQHDQAWQRAHHREVFEGVMRGPHSAVSEASADGNDLHIGVVIADIVADLLEAAERWKIGD